MNNVTFKFSAGSSLTVNGILNSANSTFTSTSPSTNWSGIKFNSGSNGVLDGCGINNVQAYGGYAISIYGSSPTIQNCTIENNIIACGGISITNSNTPYLYNNIIRNNSYNGIYIYNSNAYLRFNTITASSTYAAVYCDYFSTPLFAAPSGGYEEGMNTLQNGYYGLYGGYYSNINAGTSGIAYHNRFLNNSYANVYASYYTTIYAGYDWWGQSTANKYYAVSGSVIYPDHPLSSDPASWAKILASANALPTSSMNTSSLIFNVANNSSVDLKRNLADMIKKFRETKDKSIIRYVKQYADNKSDPDSIRPIAMEVLSNILALDNNAVESVSTNEVLIKDYTNTIHEKNGLMNLFYIYYNSGDLSKAENILSKISKDYTANYDVKLARWLINSENNKANSFSQSKTIAETKNEKKI